ncbi:MAG: sugar ABC transporter permease, partial [Eubacterium sp.]|nr:sugar ABC transporter permease [Eubacterium sp.]
MRNGKTYPIWFAIGALLIYTALFVVPSLIGIGYSFTDWSAYTTEIHFVGFENFKLIFSADENYMKIISNTLIFTFLTTLLKNVLGLLLAVLLTKSVKLLNFHRGVMFMPSVLSTLILGMVFSSILNPASGILNTFLRTIGLDALALPWLTDPKYAFGTVIAVDV